MLTTLILIKKKKKKKKTCTDEDGVGHFLEALLSYTKKKAQIM